MRPIHLTAVLVALALVGCQNAAFRADRDPVTGEGIIPILLEVRPVLTAKTPGAVRMPSWRQGKFYWVSPASYVAPEDFVQALAITDVSKEDAAISVRFTEEGERKLRQATRSKLGERIAMIVDGRVVSTPLVETEFGSDRVVIRGWANDAEARQVVAGLNADR